MLPERSMDFFSSCSNTVAEKDGDGEIEASTVVLSSFLLDLCHRFPEKRIDIVTQLMTRLKQKVCRLDDGFFVPNENEASVASLCHATVLITRALPRTRLLALKEGLVNSLVSCIESFLSTDDFLVGGSEFCFPMWLTPALLLLDIMAQPVVAFSDDKLVNTIIESTPDNDFLRVQREHKLHVTELFRLANLWFSPTKEKQEKKRKNSTVEDKNTSFQSSINTDEVEMAAETTEDTDTKESSAISSIPAYFPLLSYEATQSCLTICQKLLCTKGTRATELVLPPGVAHSTLLMLLRLLRTPKLSSQCLQMGIAEAVLSLPKESSFTGNTGLITLIFRRLLEDEPTLQSAMETEIRGSITKLSGKKDSSSKEEKTPVTLSAFIEAVTPLLCRDPLSFLKAMALSVVLDTKEKSDTTLSLISSSERSRRMKLIAESLNASAFSQQLILLKSARKEDMSRQRRASSGSKGKGKILQKSSKRYSMSKKGKKEKPETPKSAPIVVAESPAIYITSLLINAIISSTSESSQDVSQHFLWTGNLLDILADLILAVPACASAVHNYRQHRNKEKAKKLSLNFHVKHALSGCTSPPKTFVTFLLHSLLPQDRWTIRNDSRIWDRRKEETEDDKVTIKMKKKEAYRILKISQTTARVLVALVVRPGEGRKRVIADLSFALSGGRIGHGAGPLHSSNGEIVSEFKPRELHALHAWGELCLGLAAPRSNGKNLEGVSSLSIENVKWMLEYGIVHSLLFALQRVKLYHPMASSTCASLLLPLEVLTRASVTDAVKKFLSQESGTKDGETQTKDSLPASGSKNDDNVIVMDPFAHESYEDNDMGDVGSNPDEDDIEDDIEDDESRDDDDATSDDSNDDEPSDGEEEETDDDDEDMDDEEDESAMEEDEEVSSEEVEEEGGWDVDYDAFQAEETAGLQEFDDIAEEGTDRIDENADEGWTRIESTGFGGMLLGGRRNGFGSITLGDRGRGFIDAAETMIGTLLRNGDINGDALAEIEGTLGIRIMSGGRSLRATLRSGDLEGDSIGLRVLNTEGMRTPSRGTNSEVIGTLPHIHQRSQPDIGYSTFGRSGQRVEVSSMEYVYGGPSVTGGCRNYDVYTALCDESDSEFQFTLTQLDLHLFPGGPAAAASARTQHSLHPLLCGVDLPPMNSVVSDLLPHGVRATRRGQMTTRRPGDWSSASFAPGGYLVSTSNGNIIRSNRTHSGAPLGGGLSNRNVSGPVGWTDDGLPVDATVAEFSSAFERALQATICTADDTGTPASESQRALSDGNLNENSGVTRSNHDDGNRDGLNGPSGSVQQVHNNENNEDSHIREPLNESQTEEETSPAQSEE
jgi:hypothetical protein